MSYLLFNSFDENGLRTGTIARVASEDAANGIVFETLMGMCDRDTEIAAPLFQDWISVMANSCTCGNGCPRSMMLEMMDGVAQLSYLEELPF